MSDSTHSALAIMAIIALAVLGVAPAMALAGETMPSSLCRPEEQVIFSCSVAKSSKLVSLCGSKSLDNRRGYLQYRFGTLGAIELRFPRERANTQLAFRYAHYFRAQVDRTEVTFDNDGYRYVLFDYNESDLKPPTRTAGVKVTLLSKPPKENAILCAGRPASKIGVLATVIPRDADNPLNQ